MAGPLLTIFVFPCDLLWGIGCNGSFWGFPIVYCSLLLGQLGTVIKVGTRLLEQGAVVGPVRVRSIV